MKTKIIKNFYFRSSLFTILSLLAAVSGYALYPILVRILSPQAFGDFAVTTATINQVLAILLAVNIISIYLVKKYGEEKSKHYAQIIQKVLVWVFIGIGGALLLLSPYLLTLFQIEKPLLFIPLAAVLLTSLPVVVWTGYLQGHKELVRIGIFSFSSSLAKLGFASLLGFVGGSIGALSGVLIGTLVGIVIINLYPGVKLPNVKTIFTKTTKDDLRFLLSLRGYIIQAIFVVGVLGVLQNYDISLAKAMFEPSVAGVYSGISILSNALYYLAFILVWIVLPEITIDNPKVNRRILGTAYKLLGLLAVGAVGGELILKDHLLGILLGGEFADKTNLLLFATLYQLTLVGIALYAFYLLTQRKTRSILLVGLLLVSCITLPVNFAHRPEEMIRLLWISAVISIALYGLLMGVFSLLGRKATTK